MKKFKFRLETVLRLKEKNLSDRLIELARISNVLKEEESKLDLTKARIEEIKSNLENLNKGNGELNIIEIQSSKGFLIKLSNDIRSHEQIILQVKKAVEERRKQVQEALKEKNILEKLREKQEEQHFKEILYKESVELDDIAISRYKVS